jgi:hypothetical protein
LKKLAKPFSIGARKSKAGFIREQDIDDMLSEISTPEIDNALAERKKILEALEKHEKHKEDLDLESCLSSLTGKPMDYNNRHEIDSVGSKTISDMK